MKSIKKIIKLFIVLNVFFVTAIKAQLTESDGMSKIALSVIMPDNLEGLNASQLSNIETKIVDIVSIYGLSATGYDNSFVIYPKFAIYETSVVEGGMQNITVTNCEFSLIIKQISNNIIFSSISKQLKGSGYSQQEAITNSISKIDVNDNAFAGFINIAKQKIISYYNSRCGDLILKADALAKKQEYGQALGILVAIPEEVSCYNKVQDRTIIIYKAYQNQVCAKQIMEAKVAIAQKNFSGALNALGSIDPSTICFAEAKQLIKSTESKIDAEQQKQWNLRMKMYEDNISLERQRLQAAKEVAISYANAHPKTITYLNIIR